jgi:hypothetical protein
MYCDARLLQCPSPVESTRLLKGWQADRDQEKGEELTRERVSPTSSSASSCIDCLSGVVNLRPGRDFDPSPMSSLR